MAKTLLFTLILIFLGNPFFGQTISFEPSSTHFYEPYSLNLHGTGKMYYTLDGTTPTLNSTSATNNLTLLIDRNLEVKVFLVNSSGETSPIVSKKYYTGSIPTAKIYFKPPSHWPFSCFYVGMINPDSINGMILDTIHPFQLQDTNCEGWLTNTIGLAYELGEVGFNNCPLFYNAPGAEFMDSIVTGSLLVYDYSLGIITNPPACLNLSTEENKNYTIVKVMPNPADDFVLIKSDFKFDSYSIYDYSGKIIETKKLTSDRIVVSQLNKGNYLIKLYGNNKNEFVVKFIKK